MHKIIFTSCLFLSFLLGGLLSQASAENMHANPGNYHQEKHTETMPVMSDPVMSGEAHACCDDSTACDPELCQGMDCHASSVYVLFPATAPKLPVHHSSIRMETIRLTGHAAPHQPPPPKMFV